MKSFALDRHYQNVGLGPGLLCRPNGNILRHGLNGKEFHPSLKLGFDVLLDFLTLFGLVVRHADSSHPGTGCACTIHCNYLSVGVSGPHALPDGFHSCTSRAMQSSQPEAA